MSYPNQNPVQKLRNILSICRKANKISLGFAPILESLQTGSVCGVLTSSDISKKTLKEVYYACEKKHIPVCPVPLTMTEIGMITGRKAAVAAILDQGFFERIRQLCEEHSTATASDLN
ncbi:MAG: ribosomal L7Ae/L30e/S12e/Gadd45 family protein [Oscillospiraceae bacterium]|nr:ribosomal L7Ae/L30e/S12e/Gadd45 family protein [Oscillospiraceae bacterium]